METNNGSWTLTDLGDGRTQALYSVEIVPKVPIVLRVGGEIFFESL